MTTFAMVVSQHGFALACCGCHDVHGYRHRWWSWMQLFQFPRHDMNDSDMLTKVLPPRISRVQPRTTSAYIVGVWSVETISDPCPAHCWLDDCPGWWRHFKNYKNCFQYFSHLSHLFWPSDTGQAVAKVCSPVTYKDKAELPFALGWNWREVRRVKADWAPVDGETMFENCSLKWQTYKILQVPCWS